MSKNNQKRADGFEQIEEATISTEQFIERNSKLLVRGLLVVIIVIAAIFETLFEKDSFNLALNGNINNPGFLQIIEDYGSTPSGNLAKYYAGLCYLYLGDNQNAIKYLEKFSTDDMIFSTLAKANIGDAYMQLGEYKKAAGYYQKASSDNTNLLTTPSILMKAGLAYEKAKDYKNALAMYEKLEKEYPASMEAREIEKYITRAQLNMK